MSDPGVITGLPDTPWALLVDDGLDGILVLDPTDPGSAEIVTVEGQRPGDQPYRLELVGDSLVVGWGEIYAVDIQSRVSTLIGEATIFVPAAEPELLWMIDYSGGRIGQGTLRAWQVSLSDGRGTAPMEIETGGVPAIGVPAGLAIETETGISIWNSARGEVGDRLGSGNSFVSDVTNWSGSALAWCEGVCEEIHITEIPSRDDRLVVHPDGAGPRFIARGARFSADGRCLAAPTDRGEVVVHDRETGQTQVAFTIPESNLTDVEWSPSGYELIAKTPLPNGLTSEIEYHRIGGSTWGIDVSLSMGRSFVVVDELAARSFLGGE